MKIAFLHTPEPITVELFELLRAALPRQQLVSRAAGERRPAADVEVLVALGEVNRELLAGLPHLAFVQTASAGYEGVDIDAATEMGVWVANAPSGLTGNAESVAEFALLLLLATSRNLHAAVRTPGIDRALRGKRVCIVGLGTIGGLLVDYLRPFGMRVVGTDLHPDRAPAAVAAFPADQLHAAVADADYVVVCARADDSNENLIDRTALAAMKQGAILVNVARGSLVDEDALYDSLCSGRIAAAGLDVLKSSAGGRRSPLLDLPQVLVTPHVASATDLTLRGTARYLREAIEQVAAGEQPPAVLNAPPRPRRPLRTRRE